MNTYNVYFAEIYRIIKREVTGDNLYNMRAHFETEFFRITLVFDKGNGKFLDLFGNRILSSSHDYCSDVGTELVNTKSLTPFNEVIGQYRQNLPKCLIRKKAIKVFKKYYNEIR